MTQRTILQFLTFLGVGVIVAAVHFSILSALVQLRGADPVVASTIGFVVSAVLNYWLNYKLTFRARVRHAMALAKFFTIAMVGLGLNASLMKFGIDVLGLNYLVTQVGAIGCVVFWNFFANKAWTFAPERNTDGLP